MFWFCGIRKTNSQNALERKWGPYGLKTSDRGKDRKLTNHEKRPERHHREKYFELVSIHGRLCQNRLGSLILKPVSV